MITIATPDDINRALGLANGFAGQTVNEDVFVGWWQKMIKAGLATVFYRETGKTLKEAIGVLIFDSPMTGTKSAAVSFWYRTEEENMAVGILFRRAEEFLKESGVKTIYCSALLDARYPVVTAFLQGNGFAPNEVQHKKELV